MNNTLFTQKTILCMLIALLFGFGILGTVDAMDSLTKSTTASGDLQIIGPLGLSTHNFAFSTTGVTDSLRDDPGTTDTNERNNGDQLTVSASGGYITQVVIDTGTPITFPNNTTSIRLITTGELEADSNRSIGLTEAELPSGTPAVTVTVNPIRIGSVTLNVRHSQRPTGTDLQNTLSFVAYAVRPDYEVQGLTINEASSTQSPSTRYAENPSTVKIQLDGPNRNFVQVDFTATNGNLTDDFNGDGTAEMTGTAISSFTNSSGIAEVTLAPGTASSTVTASISQSLADSYRIIYVFGPITLSRTAPSSREGFVGQPAGRAIIAFRVRDSATPPAGIGGLLVTFEILEPKHGAYLYELPASQNPGTYDDDFDTNGKITTHSNGDAKLFFWLGTETGIYTLRATVEGSTDVVDYNVQTNAIRVADEAVPAGIFIHSGDGQQAELDLPAPEPLRVKVRSADGFPVAGAPVTFSTTTVTPNSGTLIFLADSDTSAIHGRYNGGNRHGVAAENRNLPQSSITINTDRDGTAAVVFNVGNKPGVKEVEATISIYDNQTRFVTFTTTAVAPGTVTPPVTRTGGLSVVAPSTGTVGVPFDVTVLTSDNSSGQLVEFSSLGGTFSQSTIQTDNNGRATVQFTPNTTGPVDITATATGYTDGEATVQVSASTAASTLSILTPRSVNVTAGATYNVVIDAGAPNVLITLSGTGFQVAQGTTGSNNSVTIPITIPNTAGRYELYANATGYTPQLIVVIVTGNVTPTTGVPVRITIPSGQTQTVNIGSSAALQVLVTRTGTNQPQSGVEVTFRDSGGNDIATRTTNSSGNATYQLPITSTARRLISAVITDTNVDKSNASPVTFDITGTVAQPTQSTRLTIFQPNSIGAPGAVHPLTILMATPTGGAAVNQIITLTVRDSTQALISTTTVITGTDGRATTTDTFRLPTTAGTYAITATSDGETRTINVTVVAIKLLKDASDNVSGDNQEGDRGEVLDDPFVVKVVQDNTNETPMAGVPITWTVTDGDGELSTSSSATSGDRTITVNSDANGNASAYLVLGDDDEDNEVTASTGITGVSDVFFDATGVLIPYDLEIVSGNNQRIAVNERSDPLIVRVTDEDGNDLQGVTVSFSSRGPAGASLTRSAETDRLGEAEADFVSRVAGTYTITARVAGIPTVTFTLTVGDLADSIRIVSGNNQSGDPGTELDNPLVVEVLDDDDDPVSGVTVTFRVTGGGGSLSATSVDTNNRGRAETYLTLGDSPGGNSVRASVSGVSTAVTFAATAVPPAPPEPVIHLGAGQRVDTYWINTDSGTLHRLVGSGVENIASGVTNVVGLAVTSDRLYWIEDTGNNSGRLRRSNLNGTNIQLIRDLTATPAGITVDTANSKIYMTNGWGKVQAINLDGSGYAPNLITGLSDPTDIAVGAGKVYWITDGGTVHSANVDGSGVTQIAGGYSALGSIAVGGGKVFWTEAINESDGNIHSANLDGSSVTELVSLLAAPYGISVDAGVSKLYFTNSRGRIMQSNLNGGGIKIVASNLVSPGDVSVPSGPATRPPGTFSRYDVNRDGKVDNTDAALVANALGESPPSDPNLDVNGDGSVNFLDLLLVFDNRDESNAAPVAVANERPKVSPEEVQHQIDLLLATDNHSATAQFTLAYLQSLLEVVTPEKTRLLANYPNPFNPETWIPYQLAASSEVQITIYNSAGKEVRTLSLGHQSEGYYTDRSRAAYWDGRNAIGEQVASGVYFYTLITDRMSATRKMLILK